MTEASPFSGLGCYNLFMGGVFPFFFSFLFSTFFFFAQNTSQKTSLLLLPSFLFSLFFFSQDKTTKSKKRKHKIVRVKQPPRVITPCEDQTSGQRLNLHRKQLKWRHTWEASPNRRTR